jgi:hypothetical protein
VQRLEAEGRLPPALPASRALDILWMLSSFEAFDRLSVDRRLPVDEVADVLAEVAMTAVVRNP